MMMFGIDLPSISSIAYILPLNRKHFLRTPCCLNCRTRPDNRAVGFLFHQLLRKHCTGWALASSFMSVLALE